AISVHREHEFNLVLYQGAYRLINEGEIYHDGIESGGSELLALSSWNEQSKRIFRRLPFSNHARIINYVDNFPGNKGDWRPWSWKMYTRPDQP
ncbi:hypothetical protein ACFL41_02640, partial [Gemmatimonadota bacterium]